MLARGLLDELPVPWRAVAGNHDEGDATLVEGAVEGVVDAAARHRWTEHVGPPWWAEDLDGWWLLAVDAQLVGSGLEAEDEQWAWLEDRLSAAGDRPVVLASHKPVATPPGEGSEGPGIRFVPAEGRARLATLLDRATVPLVVSGHVHQGRGLDLGGRHHLWAPTAWAVLPEHVQPALGDKRCAVVDLDLHPDGTWSAAEVVPGPGPAHGLGRPAQPLRLSAAARDGVTAQSSTSTPTALPRTASSSTMWSHMSHRSGTSSRHATRPTSRVSR